MNNDYFKTKESFEELMNDGNEIYLYLREGNIYKEVKGRITEVGHDYIKLDCYQSKKIPIDAISPIQIN